jgi:hypothetical protein
MGTQLVLMSVRLLVPPVPRKVAAKKQAAQQGQASQQTLVLE